MNKVIATPNLNGITPNIRPMIGTRRFAKGQWREVRRWDTPTFTAMYVDYERDKPIAGDWYSEEFHYFDLSLSGRPPGARGCFVEQFTDYQRLGKFCVVPAGYRYRGEGGTGRQKNLYVFLRADHEFFGEKEFGANLPKVLRDCMNLRSDMLTEILLRICDEVRQPGIAHELLLQGLATTLLAETIRWLDNLRKLRTRKGGLAPWRMQRIEERIHCGEKLPTVSELARLCRLSRRHLARAFREETGLTISAFIQHTTLERAKNLLCTTEQPISSIAAMLGFTNAAVFSTAFRRSTGESPRNYRTARVA